MNVEPIIKAVTLLREYEEHHRDKMLLIDRDQETSSIIKYERRVEAERKVDRNRDMAEELEAWLAENFPKSDEATPAETVRTVDEAVAQGLVPGLTTEMLEAVRAQPEPSPAPEWGDPIAVDGKRPEWLRDDEAIMFGSAGDMPVSAWSFDGSLTTFRLPASHAYYAGKRAGQLTRS